MDKYYHFTKYEFLDDISQNGLNPQVGDRSFSINDERHAVYLSRGKLSAVLMFFAMKWFYNSHKGKAGEELLSSALSSIDYYTQLLSKRQHKNEKIKILEKRNDKVIAELKKNREAAIMVKNQVENMKRYASFEEYWGDGVYLSIGNVPDIKYNYPDFHNCWVERKIEPDDLNVVVLKNKETGELIDDKSFIINYFMATTSSSDLFTEYLRTIGIKDDKYMTHSTMKEFDQYYYEHKEEFDNLKSNYELKEIPIKEYMNNNKKSNAK